MQLQQSVLKELGTKTLTGIMLNIIKPRSSNLHLTESEGKLLLKLFKRVELVC